MQGLMIHTDDGHRTGLQEVLDVPVPTRTQTYVPVPHGKLIEFVRNEVVERFGADIRGESYGLSKKDMQMFGVMRVDTGNPNHGLSIGLRNSYDKSLSVGFASGASVFVCDNLCFSGSGCVVLRKHTLNVWSDIRVKVNKALAEAENNYENMAFDLNSMADVPVKLDRGYELIGKALGHQVLKPQQATIAMADWREPRHEEFSDRNLYSLYNCFTEGLKKGPAGSMLDRHTAAHDWFKPMIPAPPVVITPVVN